MDAQLEQALGKSIGIDFGTTTTIVYYKRKNGKFRPLKDDSNKALIPSTLYFHSRDQYDIGEAAQSGTEIHPLAGVANFKSHLHDKDYRYEVTAANGEHFFLRPKKAAELFLKRITKSMEAKLIKEFGVLQGTIERAVITVPAMFPAEAKSATKRVARECGFDTIKLTKEPTAAATDYLSHNPELDKPGTAILVYDFGGGTFDVSVVLRQQDSIKEVATSGNNSLGGNLLTERIVAYLIERIEERYAVSFPEDADDLEDDERVAYRKNMAEIRSKANTMKEKLSEESEAESTLLLTFDGVAKYFDAYLSRDDFEDLIRADIERTVSIVQHTLDRAAEEGVEHIDAVVLAGGSSNVPLVQSSLKAKLPHLEIDPAVDAEFLIARGAALLAERVEQLDQLALITNTQIGTSAREGMVFNKFHMLIKEHTPLPASGSQTFVLERDGQTEYKIAYYEYDVDNYPGMTRTDQEGMEQVEVLTVQLPPGLKKDDTEIDVVFTMQQDSSLEIQAITRSKSGTVISDKNLQIVRDGDWE